MLNTFRVIFVDTNGNVVTKPSANCEYVQNSDSGYYSFDWGSPGEYSEGTSSNSISAEYAFDNRSVNDLFKKYGIQPTGFVGEDPLPKTLKDYGRTGELVNSGNMGRPTKTSSGVTLNWPGSAVGTQTTDAFAKDRFILDASSKPIPLDQGGLGANLKTPSDLFESNKSIRVIGGNDTDARDYSETTSDLEFDQDASEGNVDSSGDKFPKYLYLGIVAAGGPCGGVVSCKNTNFDNTDSGGGAIPTCPGAVDAVDGNKGLYICPSYSKYSRQSWSAGQGGFVRWPAFTNFVSTLGDDVGSIPIGDSGLYPNQWVNRVSESGKKVGVFLKACEGTAIDDSSDRKTLIVRLVNLGKGGVESYNTNDVITNDGTGNLLYNLAVNKESTTFPSITDRHTEIEIYESSETGSLTWADNGVLSIKCEGGRALPTVKGFTTPRTCASQIAAGQCSDCYDFIQGGDAIIKECTGWPGIEYNNFVPEISSNPNTVTLQPEVIITKGPKFDVGRYSMARTDQGDFVDVGFNMFGGIEGIENSDDWYDRAGGVQRNVKVIQVPIQTADAPAEPILINGQVASDYTFRGDTKYILDQSMSVGVDNNEFPLIISGGFYDRGEDVADISETPNPPFMKIEYFLEGKKVTATQYYTMSTFEKSTTRKIEMTLSKNGDCDSLIFGTGLLNRISKYIPSTTQTIPEPGLGAKSNFVIETQNVDIEDFHEGVGGNGGAVYVGWGEQVNNAVSDVIGRRSARGADTGALLIGGNGFGETLIRPEPINTEALTALEDEIIQGKTLPIAVAGNTNQYQNITYNSVWTPNKRLSTTLNGEDGTNPYPPIGDAETKGNDVAPIFRFTEMPEITREGDFWITAQAYHMEGIHKITFIMDGGAPVDVYEPIEHPDNLGTDYDNSASGMGKGYKEYMVRVSTAGMEHNKVHEIRAIAWPNSGYPIVLQGEKQDQDRKISGASAHPEEYSISPTVYPWQKNVWPEECGIDVAPDTDPETGLPKVWPPKLRDDPQMVDYAYYPESEFIDQATEEPFWDELDKSIYTSPDEDPKEWDVIPGELIPNMQGYADHNGNPAWWIRSGEVNTVAYHGFWFRYQLSPELDSAGRPVDPGNNTRRRVIYVDSSYKEGTSWYNGASDGTYGKPYETMDAALNAKRNDGTSEDFYSAKVYLKPETYLDTNIADISNSDLTPISDGFVNGADLAFLLRAFGDTPDSPEWIDPEKMYSLADLNRDGIVDAKDLALLLGNWTGNDGTELVERLRGSVNNWFAASDPNDVNQNGNERSNAAHEGSFQNAVDHDVSRDSLQNPACHFLSIEPDITWYEDKTKSTEGYWNPNKAAPEFNNEIIMLPFNSGWKGWNDDETALGGRPKNLNLHIKNVRFVTGLQVKDRLDMFLFNNRNDIAFSNTLPEGHRHKDMSFILDSCMLNHWSGLGEQLKYIDSNGARVGNKVRYPDPRDQGTNEFGEPCSTSGNCTRQECTHPPLDRSVLRSVAGPLNISGGSGNSSWEFYDEYEWYDTPNELLPEVNNQHLTPREQYDQIGANRQLLDPRLPGYNTLIEWDPKENAPATLTIPSNSFSRPMTQGNIQSVDLHGFNCSISGYTVGDRWKGCGTVKNYLELDTPGDTTGRSTGAALNFHMDIRTINSFPGRRLVTTGANTVHGDLGQIDEGDRNYLDNRIYADVLMTNTATQLGHFPSEGSNYRRNSRRDPWRVGHKTRNWAFVNIITDTTKGSASMNLSECWDHMYLKGCRNRRGFFSIKGAGVRRGMANYGERWVPQNEHWYVADQHEADPSFSVPSEGDLDPSLLQTGDPGYARTMPANTKNGNGNGWDSQQVGQSSTGFYKLGDKELQVPVVPAQFTGSGRLVTTNFIPSPIAIGDLHWYPLYDVNGDINTTLYDPNDIGEWQDNFSRFFPNAIKTSNSKFIIESCIYLNGPDESGRGKVALSPEQKANYNRFGLNGLPFIEEAYNPDSKYQYSMGPPTGIASDGSTPIEFNGAGEPSLEHSSLFIPTIITGAVNYDTADTIETFTQGRTSPIQPVMAYTDDPDSPQYFNLDLVDTNGRVFDYIEAGYPNAGDRVWFYYLYDRDLFVDILRNGGWNYNGHWPDDYVPHKL